MVTFNCCKGCTVETGRHPGCHSTCAYYMETKKIRDAEIAAIQAEKNKYDEINQYLKHSKIAYAKRRGGKYALSRAYL